MKNKKHLHCSVLGSEFVKTWYLEVKWASYFAIKNSAQKYLDLYTTVNMLLDIW